MDQRSWNRKKASPDVPAGIRRRCAIDYGFEMCKKNNVPSALILKLSCPVIRTLLPFCLFGVSLLKPNSRNKVPVLFRGYWGT